MNVGVDLSDDVLQTEALQGLQLAHLAEGRELFRADCDMREHVRGGRNVMEQVSAECISTNLAYRHSYPEIEIFSRIQDLFWRFYGVFPEMHRNIPNLKKKMGAFLKL